MPGQENHVRSTRRACWGALASVAAAGVVVGCAGAPDKPSLLDEPVPESPGATQPTGDDERLRSRSYAPGDCVDWESTDGEARTRVVACDEPHRLQVVGRVDAPDSATYPSPSTWDTFIATECGAAVEEFLGVTLDPYGRISPQAIVPHEETWGTGERIGQRDVWCGAAVYPGSPDRERSTDDPRTADQAYDHAPGTCLRTRSDGPEVRVPCAEPHTKEITARVDFGDLPGPPSPEQMAERCRPPVDGYLGGPPQPPWAYGYEGLAPESWAAGTRTAHCFVGQFEPDGTLVEVTGSAKG